MLNLKRLRQWMDTNDYTQERLAVEAGIDGATMHRILKGITIPRIDKVQAIQRVTGIPIEVLLPETKGKAGGKKDFGSHVAEF